MSAGGPRLARSPRTARARPATPSLSLARASRRSWGAFLNPRCDTSMMPKVNPGVGGSAVYPQVPTSISFTCNGM